MKNTIILVVCPANVDIEVHEALKLAKEVHSKNYLTSNEPAYNEISSMKKWK